MKKITDTIKNTQAHWVGDGFPVRSLLSYNQSGQKISPFLLLDHAGPQDFEPSDRQRGVGDHPHRGFETVTIAYDGEVEHKDSTGAQGKISPGDVQWMTAGSGVIHQEMHGKDFSKKGGAFHMVQLWVNLPAKHKMTKPCYQTLLKKDIPVVPLENGAGHVRVIGGEYNKVKGPAHTFSPVNVWDTALNKGKKSTFKVKEGYTTLAVVLKGKVKGNEKDTFDVDNVIFFDTKGGSFSLEALDDAQLLLLNGAPINEPIFGYGPFVMNTKDQINEAMDDFNKGRFIK